MITKPKKRKIKKKLSSLIAASVLIPSLLLPSGFSSVHAVSSNALSKNAISTSAKADLNTTLKNKVSSELLSKFDKEDRVTFLVKMKKQVDTTAVAKEAEKKTTAKKLTAAEAEIQKRSAVVSELRATAKESQYNVIEYLEKQIEAGKAKDLQSFYIVNGLAVTATKEVMEQVALMEEVELITPNESVNLIQPTVTSSIDSPVKEIDTSEQTNSIEWNINQVNAPDAWAMGIDGSGTVVASIDTGVQWDHPALKEKYRGYSAANPNSPNHEFNWFDATASGGSAPYDDQGHGTHVTGTMVGSEPNGGNQIGVAPGAKWIAVKAFTASGGTSADLLEAGEWVLAPKDASGTPHPEMAPDVVNNSWGGGPGLNEWFRPMVQAWRAAEIFPEFSAGNTTLTNPGGAGSVAVPANYPESFATAATNNANALASFSLRGPSPYGEVKPDISAPGVNIRSAVPGGSYEGGWNGTSMAGPHVSGVVALLKQVNANLSVDEIETIITETAVPLTDSTYPNVPNNGYGAGLVDAHAAVASIVDGLGTIAGTVAIEGDDDENPTFTHEPVRESYKAMDLPLSITAADNVSVNSVVASYKKADGTWAQIPAVRSAGDYKSGTYNVSLPGAELTGNSVDYKFSITDFGGNTVETPVYSVALLNGISVGYFEDFESTPIGWTTLGTADWKWGVPTVGPGSAYSGEKVFATNLSGTYEARANMSLQMPPIDLPEGNSYLQFKQWYNLERNYDFGHVFISTDGENYTQLARFNDLSNQWVNGEVDLSAYAGQRVYIQFNLTSDGSVQRPGWFIDDVALTDTPIEATGKAKNGTAKRNEAAKDKAANSNKGLSLGVIDNPGLSAKPKVDPNKIVPFIKEKEEAVDSGKPAPVLLPLSATVNVLETGRSVYTNPQDGSYQFVSSTGTFTLQASSYGYVSQTQSVTVERDGTSTANFVLQPIPQGHISGSITNAQTGLPVTGATIFLVEDAAIAPVTTDEEGNFRLTAYEGSYTVKITAPGYAGTQTEVTIEGGETSTLEITLNPFIGYEGEIGYDDGTAENARAYNAAGNKWAVKMSLAEGESQANVTGALLRFWDTSWPNPGGTAFQVSVHDANADGSPGNLIAGPFDAEAQRDGTWTRVDLSEHGIMVDGDFYIVYTQTSANPNSPGLATDEDGKYSGRSWGEVSGVWAPSPEAEGNYMIRAIVNYEVSAPQITSPVNGSYSNKEEVIVEGATSPNMTVEVFHGDEVSATVTADQEGKFSTPVKLNKGENTFKVRVSTERGYSETSEAVTVIYDADAPELTITAPEDGSKSNRESVTVTGTITDAYLDAVTVNGEKATVKDGKYSKRILLEEGLNTITVKATDLAGNETEKSVTVDVKYTAPEITNLVPAEDKVLLSGDTVKIEFDSEPGLEAVFSILMPLTNIVGAPANALELPMRETSPGHYVGYYTATRNVVAPGAQVEVKVTDDYQNVTTQRASGLLYINQQ